MPYVLAIVFTPNAHAEPAFPALFLFPSLIYFLSYLERLYCMCHCLYREIYVLLLPQMIDTGCSGRLMCCQDTHSPFMSMDKEFLHTRLTQQSGGSPTDTHISSQETGISQTSTKACNEFNKMLTYIDTI